jgi:uncharacterized RDD family membrane protein YckC
MTEQQPPPEATPAAASPTEPSTANPTGSPAAAAAGPLVDWAVPETRPLPGRRQIVYADIPNRVIAYIVDLVAVGIIAIGAGLVLVLAFIAGTGSTNVTSPLFNLIFNVVTAVIVFAYFFNGWTSRRATLGMRWLGLQIGNATDGATLTLEQGLRRYVALFGPSLVYQFLSPLGAGLAFLLGSFSFVWVLYLLIDTARSDTKQGFHDRFATSLVVKVTRALT